MGLGKITTNRKNGGSGRPLPGFDHYTGLIALGSAPNITGKWKQYPGPPAVKGQQLFSYSDAAAAGIIPFTDNVAATGTYLITTKGNTDDVLNISIVVPTVLGGTITINFGDYKVPVASSTIALQGADYTAVINGGTVNHGFSASFNTATITITIPKKYGISLNSGTPIVITKTGAFAGTITQFGAGGTTAGTMSLYSIWDYHISEYFRIFPKGNLWFGITDATTAFNEIKTLQKAAKSKIRQIGFYDTIESRAAYNNITGTITQIHNAALLVQDTAPLSVFYSPNIKSVTDLSTYPDQNINIASKVQTILSQDGAAQGANLYIVNGVTVGNIGAKLATIAKSRLSSSDAQAIEENNLSDGVENDTASFGNGVLLELMTENLQDQLHDFNYVFHRKWGDEIVGTYWTSNKCCVKGNDDYANVNDNRVMDCVSRTIYTTLVPMLNSELYFNKDGSLRDYTIETFKDAVTDAVENRMVIGFGANPLISGFATDIDPTQPVKITENLIVNSTVIENGIARNITSNIGYGATLPS